MKQAPFQLSIVIALASFVFAVGCDQNPRGSVGEPAPGGRTGEFPSDNRLDDSHVEGEKVGLKGMLAAPEKKEGAEHAGAAGEGAEHHEGAPGAAHAQPAASGAAPAPAEHH